MAAFCCTGVHPPSAVVDVAVWNVEALVRRNVTVSPGRMVRNEGVYAKSETRTMWF